MVQKVAPPPPPTSKADNTKNRPDLNLKPATKIKPSDDMPDLSNATPGYLVDQVGTLRSQIKHLEKLEGYYSEAVKGRMRAENKSVFEGEEFIAVLSEVTQMRVNQEMLVQKFGQAEVEACKSPTVFNQMKVTAKVSSK